MRTNRTGQTRAQRFFNWLFLSPRPRPIGRDFDFASLADIRIP